MSIYIWIKKYKNIGDKNTNEFRWKLQLEGRLGRQIRILSYFTVNNLITLHISSFLI